MRRTRLALALGLTALFAAWPAVADDLTEASSFLCAVRELAVCRAGGDCSRIADPGELGVPDFIEVDLAAKQLRTTAASAEDRATPIGQQTRAEGLIALQGFEKGRAWSFLIVEESGRFTAAVAREELAVSAFGACTPLGAPRP